MKKSNLTSFSIFILLATACLINSCKSGCRNLSADNYCYDCNKDCGTCCTFNNSGGGGTSTKGSVVFWTNSSAYNYTTVALSDGSSNIITAPYTSGTPACLAANGAYFYLEAGSYSYTATKQGGMVVKTGTIQVNSGSCNRFLIP